MKNYVSWFYIAFINIDGCAKFDRNRSIYSQDIERNQILMLIKKCIENKRKLSCNSPNLDLININAYMYTKFYQNLEYIEEKKNIFYINQEA